MKNGHQGIVRFERAGMEFQTVNVAFVISACIAPASFNISSSYLLFTLLHIFSAVELINRLKKFTTFMDMADDTWRYIFIFNPVKKSFYFNFIKV